jgi:ADP-heptose:LPS heptosyltransferase
MSKPQRILLIEQYGIGDGVLSTPAIAGVRKAHPDAHITSLAAAGVAELRHPCPLVDRVAEISPGPMPDLGQFDMIVDLTGKLSTARLARRLRAPVRVGCPWWTGRLFVGLFYTRRVAARRGIHVVEHKCDIAVAAGASGCPVRPEIWLTEQDHEAAKSWLHAAGIDADDCVVAVNPGARSRGRAWRVDRYAAVCDALRQSEGCAAIVVGGPEDVVAARNIAALCSSKPAVAAGMLTVRQTAALLSRCAALVTGDTGPMHIAAAVGTRVIALFGRSDPWWSGPLGEGHVIVTAGLACSPCRGMPHLRHRICLTRYACMDRITPEQVIGALHQVLDHRRKAVRS